MTTNTTTEPIAVRLSTDTLTPHPRNYNQHPAEQIERLQASLRSFGQPRPIVVHRSVILAGHGVWMAAKAEGLRDIWCSVVPDDWSEERAQAYLIADNETRRGAEPDNEALATLIDETRQEVDLETLGFSEETLQGLLEDLLPDLPEPGGGDTDTFIPEQWLVLIECVDEAHQVTLLERFIGEGLTCRALTS